MVAGVGWPISGCAKTRDTGFENWPTDWKLNNLFINLDYLLIYIYQKQSQFNGHIDSFMVK